MAGMDQTIGDTLGLVNVVRLAFGQDALTELPDATRGNASDCLYHRALRDVGAESVGGSDIVWKDERTAAAVASMWGVKANGRSTENPSQIQRVIGAFDGSRLPQYNL